jgi:hypothetical protein
MKYLLLLLSLTLVACVHTPKEVIVTKPVLISVECEDFGKIEPVRALPVVYVQAKTEDGYNVLGLRGDSYSNLSILFSDIQRYISQQNLAIDYYKGCIADHNAIDLNEKGSP